MLYEIVHIYPVLVLLVEHTSVCVHAVWLCPFQVLLLIRASFGFEMEAFQFLYTLQAHGFPKVMGVLTHLDVFKNQKILDKISRYGDI